MNPNIEQFAELLRAALGPEWWQMKVNAAVTSAQLILAVGTIILVGIAVMWAAT